MKKHILSLITISTLAISNIAIAMDKMPKTSLSASEVAELRQAVVDYKKNRSQAKQEGIIQKYQNKYPNDPFVKSKVNEKAKFAGTAQSQVKKEPTKIIQQEQRPAIYGIIDASFPREVRNKKDSGGYDIVKEMDWPGIFALLDSNPGLVNEYYETEYGRTLLMIAIDGSNLSIIKTLVEKYKADPNRAVGPQGKYNGFAGQTPLMSACRWRGPETVKLLLKYGGNPYQRDAHGQDSFHYLSKSPDHPENAETLKALKQYKK